MTGKVTARRSASRRRSPWRQRRPAHTTAWESAVSCWICGTGCGRTPPPFATCVRLGETELDRLCREEPPNVYFTEVTAHSPYTAEERLAQAAFVKTRAPDCKAVFCIDENTYPALARTVLGLERVLAFIEGLNIRAISEYVMQKLFQALAMHFEFSIADILMTTKMK